MGEPLAAIDFAPGAMTSGCVPTDEFATAVAPGVVSRSDDAAVVLDLDGDGDERTGWVVFYFHIETRGPGAGRVLSYKPVTRSDIHPVKVGGQPAHMSILPENITVNGSRLMYHSI